jgi:curved DNA-binding protein CbpA
MKSPFALLGVPETADDETVKKAYLQQIREHPPEREAEQFQAIRRAFEVIKTHRDRLRYRLFQQETPDVEYLVETALRVGAARRPSEQQFLQVLNESLSKHRA